MNSPVVEAQDLKFSEAWVEDIVKKVILPLWNTYSFFTTYANIDNYKPKTWKLFYCRHGQTYDNLYWIQKNDVLMSGWDSETTLTDLWKEQAKLAWQKFSLRSSYYAILL